MSLRSAVALSSIVISGLFVPVAAQGGVMLQPAAASTDMGSFSGYEPIHAIDQTALAFPYVSGLTSFDTFVPTTGTVGGGSGLTTWYSSAGNLTGHFDFDLGGSHTIDALAIWADPQQDSPGHSLGQGVKDFVLLADDNPSFSSPDILGTYSATDGIGNADNAINFGQIFRFASTSASYVRMNILSNNGSTLTTGMVEAAFDQVVPEPATFATVTFAAAALATGRRRRA